jgi:hypothetical protein
MSWLTDQRHRQQHRDRPHVRSGGLLQLLERHEPSTLQHVDAHPSLLEEDRNSSRNDSSPNKRRRRQQPATQEQQKRHPLGSGTDAGVASCNNNNTRLRRNPSVIDLTADHDDDDSSSGSRVTGKQPAAVARSIEIITILDDDTIDLDPEEEGNGALPLQLASATAAAVHLHRLPSILRSGTLREQRQQPKQQPPRWFLEDARFDLTSANKHDNFELARRPERRLTSELTELYRQQRKLRAGSDEYTICCDQIVQLQREHTVAQQNAANDIFHQNNNSTPSMGRLTAAYQHQHTKSTGMLLSIDLHGLYVKEAIAKFYDIVLPILPVHRTMQLITGRGIHSRRSNRHHRHATTQTMKATLRDKLLIHLRQSFREDKVRSTIDPRNAGALLVHWVDAAAANAENPEQKNQRSR